jgi:hypothetical protein
MVFFVQYIEQLGQAKWQKQIYAWVQQVIERSIGVANPCCGKIDKENKQRKRNGSYIIHSSCCSTSFGCATTKLFIIVVVFMHLTMLKTYSTYIHAKLLFLCRSFFSSTASYILEAGFT